MFDDFLNQFWTSFGTTFGPKPTPESTQKLGQNWTKKVIKKGDTPKKPQSQGLGSNLLSLAHSNESFRSAKPSLRS